MASPALRSTCGEGQLSLHTLSSLTSTSPKESKPTRANRDCDGTVQSLTRALQLLELLAGDDEGYRLVDIAARSGLSSSTAHRLLTTLEQRQFVQFDRETSLW